MATEDVGQRQRSSVPGLEEESAGAGRGVALQRLREFRMKLDLTICAHGFQPILHTTPPSFLLDADRRAVRECRHALSLVIDLSQTCRSKSRRRDFVSSMHSGDLAALLSRHATSGRHNRPSRMHCIWDDLESSAPSSSLLYACTL
jgi:hypothetical protein